MTNLLQTIHHPLSDAILIQNLHGNQLMVKSPGVYSLFHRLAEVHDPVENLSHGYNIKVKMREFIKILIPVIILVPPLAPTTAITRLESSTRMLGLIELREELIGNSHLFRLITHALHVREQRRKDKNFSQ